MQLGGLPPTYRARLAFGCAGPLVAHKFTLPATHKHYSCDIEGLSDIVCLTLISSPHTTFAFLIALRFIVSSYLYCRPVMLQSTRFVPRLLGLMSVFLTRALYQSSCPENAHWLQACASTTSHAPQFSTTRLDSFPCP